MDRAVSPVVAVVLLIAITVVGVASVAAVAADLEADAASAADATGAGATSATIAVSATADGQRIGVAHRGGDPLDLRNCTLRINVDGDPLTHQPPVPYFAAAGFRGTPTGAFNSGGDSVLAPGERASLQLASTNAPHFESGDVVTVTFHRTGRRVATASVRAS